MTTTHPFKVVCAWCGMVMAFGEEPVSHGICPECAAQEEANEKHRAEREREVKGTR